MVNIENKPEPLAGTESKKAPKHPTATVLGACQRDKSRLRELPKAKAGTV